MLADIWTHADAIFVIAPLLAGVVATMFRSGRAASGLAIAVSAMTAVLALALVWRMLNGAPPSSVDALGAAASVVIAILATTAFIAFATLAAHDHARRVQPIAIGLALVVTGAAFGAVIERDVLRVALLVQTACLLCAALTGLSATRDRRSSTAAFGGVIVALTAGALAAAGAALVYAAVGAFDLAEVSGRVAAQGGDQGVWLGAGLLLAGLAAMAGLAPLHTDCADRAARTAHGAAPFVIIVARMAAFVAFVRVYSATQSIVMPGVASAIAYAVAGLGAISVVAGALHAISAVDARRLAAHALTAQFGCALIGLAAGGDDGAIAALFVVAAGAMTAVAIVVGAAAARASGGIAPGSVSAPMATLDGLSQTRPTIAASIMVAALGLTGAPLTAAFLGKWLSIEAALTRGWYWAAAAIVASSFAAVFVAGQVVERLYFRNRPVAFGAPPAGVAAFVPVLAASVLATIVFGWSAGAPLDAARMAVGMLTPGRTPSP